MHQISSKLNIYVSNVKKANVMNNDIEKIAMRFIFWSFGALALIYVFLLGNMVRNIIERRSFETEVRNLSSEVGNLELTYLSISNDIDLAFSHSMGFKETKATFATRKSLSSLGSKKITQNDI